METYDIFKNIFQQCMNPAYSIAIPVGYFIGWAIKRKPDVRHWIIPFVIGGIIIPAITVLTVCDAIISGALVREYASAHMTIAVVTGILQGIGYTAVPTWIYNLKKQSDNRYEMSETERTKFEIPNSTLDGLNDK